MLYILWGDDEFSLEETLQGIKSSLGDRSLLATNTALLDGPKITLNELNAVGSAMPFLSEKRLVIIRGLLERFEPQDRSSRVKKNGGTDAKLDESHKLAECILGFPDSTVVILVDFLDVKKNTLQKNPLYNSLAGKAEIKVFPALKGAKLFQWIQTRVTSRSGSISRQATNIFMELTGDNLYTAASEIDKLTAFTGGRLIEEKDIRMIVSASQEADIFALVDAIMDRKSGLAGEILQKLLQRGIVPPQILVLIARQIQMMIQIKDLKAQKIPAPQIQDRIGIFNPFAWERISRRAERYTLGKLIETYQSLLQTDLAIKTGRFEGDLAIDILVADLCAR